MDTSDSALSAFVPHGYCYLWEPGLLSLHVGSDALIALAYFMISSSLVFFLLHRRHFPFRMLIFFFAAFICACGITHAMEIWTVWSAIFWLDGWVKFVTAIMSLITAAVLIPAIPKALSLRSPEELELANQALRSSEARARALLDNAPDAIVAVDSAGLITAVNKQAEHLFGYSAEELIGLAVSELVPEGARPHHHRWCEGYFRQPRIRPMGGNLDLSARRQDGSSFPVEISLGPMKTEDDFWVMATIRDVSARQQITQALRASEEQYRSLINDVLDNSLVGIMIVDAVKEIVWINRALENYFGIDKTQLVGRHRLQLLEERTKWIFDNPEEYAQHVHAAYQNNDEVNPIECHIAATGERQERWLEHRSQPIQSGLYEGGRIEQFYDITERVHLFQALNKAQKMETLGQLTGGVAHDFNNLLTVIIGNLQLLEEELEDQPEPRKLVIAVLKAALRGAGMTHKLLAFARRQPLHPKIIDLNLRVQNILDLLERILGENIAIHTKLYDGLWNAVADPGELETVLVNLAVNARDAMPNGGKLLFETSNEILDDDDISEPMDAAPGDYVVVAVSDTGCGMSKETLQRVFEPFFTTKPTGKGSGLGLSMVYGFAKQSGGQVRIYSEVGKGTTARLYLPKAENNPVNQASPVQSTEIPKGNQETILVVEDDNAVREMAVRMLFELGYQTLEAENAETALRIVSEAGDQIQVLFTDVVLSSDMNGSDLAEKIHQTQPAIRVLYTSGYAEQFAILSNDLKSNIELLSKPYSKKHLARKLRTVLESSQ